MLAQSSGLWFPKVKRDQLARSTFTSVTDLALELRFITKYNERLKQVR